MLQNKSKTTRAEGNLDYGLRRGKTAFKIIFNVQLTFCSNFVSIAFVLNF